MVGTGFHRIKGEVAVLPLVLAPFSLDAGGQRCGSD